MSMNGSLRVAGLLAALAGASYAQEPAWTTDYAAALTTAKAEGKLVLLDFTGSDWCGWCVKLKDEVFSKPEFAEWASKKAVLVEVDFPKKKKLDDALRKQNDELKKKFPVTGYPTIVFVDVDGKEIARTGYVKGGAAAWIKKSDETLAAKMKPKPADPTWIEDLDAGIAQAKKEKKVVLADFTGSDWCGWCIKLKSEVFDTPEFKAWAAKKAVLVELDFPRKKEQPAELKKKNEALATKHGVQGFPTILVFDGAGEKIGQLGYVEGGPTKWIEKAEELLAKKK